MDFTSEHAAHAKATAQDTQVATAEKKSRKEHSPPAAPKPYEGEDRPLLDERPPMMQIGPKAEEKPPSAPFEGEDRPLLEERPPHQLCVRRAKRLRKRCRAHTRHQHHRS